MTPLPLYERPMANQDREEALPLSPRPPCLEPAELCSSSSQECRRSRAIQENKRVPCRSKKGAPGNTLLVSISPTVVLANANANANANAKANTSAAIGCRPCARGRFHIHVRFSRPSLRDSQSATQSATPVSQTGSMAKCQRPPPRPQPRSLPDPCKSRRAAAQRERVRTGHRAHSGVWQRLLHLCRIEVGVA